MIKSAHQTMIMFIVLFYYLAESKRSSFGFGESKVTCKEADRRALLEIRAGLIEYHHVLSSWGEEEAKRECCDWIGIRCNDNSGHVVSLDLSLSTFNSTYYNDAPFGVKYISPSLVHLEYLSYLNLSGIYFDEISIPSFIGNLSKLTYLDLSSTSLTGQVPPQLGNLSSLKFLDLSRHYENGMIITNLGWASRLSSLQVLKLGNIDMSTAYDWANVVSNLRRLTVLGLSNCYLPNIVVPSLSLVNSSKSLYVVDLSGNSLSDSIFQLLFNYNHSLVHLDISYCWLTSYFIFRAFENMVSLEYLSLASNQLEGSILKSFPNITALNYLDLSSNKLEGSIPKSFGNMEKLEYLDLRKNKLEGEIPRSIWEICTLETLYARSNNLSGQIHFARSSYKCSHFNLKYLDLRHNQITGRLLTFTMYPSLIDLRLSSNRFHGKVSETIGQLSNLKVLYLSGNLLNGVMSEAHFMKLLSLNRLDLSNNPSLVLNFSSHWIPPFQLKTILLGSCHLGPRFPKWLQTQKYLIELDISNSRISDSVPNRFWNASTYIQSMNLSYNRMRGTVHDQSLVKYLSTVDLSYNQFEGSIPIFLLQVRASYLSHNKFSSLNSICNVSEGSMLGILDVSNNQLVGELLDCWFEFSTLRVLILRNNKMSGNISMGTLTSEIRLMDLSNNSFTKLQRLSQSYTELIVLDVGENRLVGPVPKWIGAHKSLVILNLRSNQFYGSLPTSLCSLPFIQVLDLSSNNISGKIPKCVGNLSGMTKKGNPKDGFFIKTTINVSSNLSDQYTAEVTIMWKGKMSRYKTTLRLVKSINLSQNKLVGEIPRDITKLDGLIALDLSRNGLTGQIPVDIGNLKSLEVLDLSRNHLSGNIPSSLSALNFLDTLDVSNNNLSGKIPTSTQLQSFDPSLYSGNLELCGDPLPKNCSREDSTSSNNSRNHGEDEDGFITPGFYVSLGLGFVVGFWGICGSLLLIKSWRYAYFVYLNSIGDWLYITIAMHKAKLLRIVKH